MEAKHPILTLLCVACAFQPLPAVAGYVLPPGGGVILPPEILPDPQLADSPDWSEDGRMTTVERYFYRSPGLLDSSRFCFAFNGVEQFWSQTRYSYDGQGRLIQQATQSRPNGAGFQSEDTARYFWNGDRLDSIARISTYRDAVTGSRHDSILAVKIRWVDGRPVERIDIAPTQPRSEVNFTTTATYRGDTLASVVRRPTSLVGSPQPTDTIGRAWSYAGDTVTEIRHSGSSRTNGVVSILFSARRTFFGPGGRTDSIQELYNYPASWSDTSRVRTWRYLRDGQGHLERIESKSPYDNPMVEKVFHYPPPTGVGSRLPITLPEGGSLRFVGNQLVVGLAEPVSASVTLYGPDGRRVLLLPLRLLAPGAHAIDLPEGLPQGAWIARLEGDGVRWTVPLVRSGGR